MNVIFIYLFIIFFCDSAVKFLFLFGYHPYYFFLFLFLFFFIVTLLSRPYTQ